MNWRKEMEKNELQNTNSFDISFKSTILQTSAKRLLTCSNSSQSPPPTLCRRRLQMVSNRHLSAVLSEIFYFARLKLLFSLINQFPRLMSVFFWAARNWGKS